MAKKKSVSKKKPGVSNKTAESGDFEKLAPVVAIGASSGGLQALNELLENLQPDLGMVYVIIQHLAPDHDSILPELLSRKTSMKVHQVENGMHIKVNNIYVIPPNTYMSIVDSVLTLSARIKTDGTYHSIDYFLNALAPLYQTKATAVILSGSGSDGTQGIQSIKAHGGITFAQDDSASFNSMPKTAMESGYTDFVLPCDRIAAELSVIAKNPGGALTTNVFAGMNEAELKKIQSLLNAKKGVDFTYYKQTTVNRRILRRMGLNKFRKLSDYSRYLRENPAELQLLYKDLLINVTSFFREPAMYQALTKKIFPALLKNRKPGEMIRIWTPACANGEEAYSLAICLFDYLQEKALSTPIQVFGTDLNDTSIEKARVGIYNKTALENVSALRLKRYFTKTDGKYQIVKPIRDVCIFATHNLLQDPPFSRMDLISCQNVLIYLESNPQKKILQAFHYALRPNGYLLLGKSETIGNATELFAQTHKDLRVYSRKQTSPGNNLFDFPVRSPYVAGHFSGQKSAQETAPDIDIEKETDRLLLSRFVPASVVVNKDLQILRFHGSTSHYLQPSAGRASLHLLKMVKDDLVIEIKGLVNKAKKEGTGVRKDGIRLVQRGHEREITIEVVPLKSAGRDQFYLIIFREHEGMIDSPDQIVASGSRTQKTETNRVQRLQQQLAEAREYMKTMSEEFEATREELQSANEEVLSSNEELQSINEELETSKEELQSTNEELMTINEELHERNDELKEMGDYMGGIVQTINEPLVVLSVDLRVLTANPAYYTLFRTNADRTEGNYFFELDNGMWNYPALSKKVGEIIHKGVSFENFEITHSFHHLGEKILSFNAMRLQEEKSRNRKVLLAIQDITSRRKAERELRENEERFRLLLENTFDVTMIFSTDGAIIYQSDSLERSLGYPVDQTLQKDIFQLEMVHPEDRDKQRKLFEQAKNNPLKNIRGRIRLRNRDGSFITMEVILRNLVDTPAIRGIVGNYQIVEENNRN